MVLWLRGGRSSPDVVYWTSGRWVEPTQGHVLSLISPHCPLLMAIIAGSLLQGKIKENCKKKSLQGKIREFKYYLKISGANRGI